MAGIVPASPLFCVLLVLLRLGTVDGALSDRVARGAAAATGGRPQPIYKQKPRVRREWRTLSAEMKGKVAKAFWTLKNLTTQEGQRIYGPHFYNQDDLVVQHACSHIDPGCDQGHAGPQFMTFHRLLLLKYELALLAVDPSIGALPYWNVAYDAVGGRYHDDSEMYIFSQHFFGSRHGTGPMFEVQDGLFANWSVVEFSTDRFGSTSLLAHQDGKPNRCIAEDWLHPQPCECGQDGCPTFLRTEDRQCQLVVSRWPKDPSGQEMRTASGQELAPQGQGGTFDLVYTEADFNHCIDPRQTRSWMEWQNCIEVSAGTCFQPGTSEHGLRAQVLRSLARWGLEGHVEHIPAQVLLAELQGKMPPNCSDTMLSGYFRLLGNTSGSQAAEGRGYVNYFHSQVHSKLGLDFADKATSPNDAGLFTSYHADIDRSNLHWMQAAREQLQNSNWSYPSSQSAEEAVRIAGPKPYGLSGPYMGHDCGVQGDKAIEMPWVAGTLWGDVVNAGFPFYNLFDGHDGGAQGYTHGDVLTLTAPDRTPYTYDTLEHLYY